MKNKHITKFFLARHGETEWNRLRRLQGHLNSDLTQTGKEQAINLASIIENDDIELLISSPLARALITAKVCNERLSLPLQINHDLIERNFGDWQGEFFDDLIHEPYFEQIFSKVTKHGPPNGEAGLDCGVRISQVLASIAMTNVEKKILVITHGDAIRCFLSSMTLRTRCDAYSQYGNGKVFPVEYCHSSKIFRVC